MNELFKKYLMKYTGISAGISLGFLTSALLAVTISGTINTFATGDTLSSAKINENFASLKTAIEGIKADTTFSGIVLYGGTDCPLSSTCFVSPASTGRSNQTEST